ncbi:MAG: type II toxin-antitoxin system VapB family antitoxin [Bradymonadia bacterium]|jgi:hypothetical protein
MRTTLNIDSALFHEAQARFPASTAKTVIIEEALRALIERADRTSTGPRAPRLDDPRWLRFARDGLVAPATHAGPPPDRPGPTLPLAQLLADLAADRADR